ncbi:hypothetical protein E4U53_006052 [Claviceps sorghi]|nr:hypothetical protein E4U53_006052 [Claviceps sorghi]
MLLHKFIVVMFAAGAVARSAFSETDQDVFQAREADQYPLIQKQTILRPEPARCMALTERNERRGASREEEAMDATILGTLISSSGFVFAQKRSKALPAFLQLINLGGRTG